MRPVPRIVAGEKRSSRIRDGARAGAVSIAERMARVLCLTFESTAPDE